MIKKLLLVFITLCALQVNAQTNTSKIAIIENFWTEKYSLDGKTVSKRDIELHLAKNNPIAYSEFQKYKRNEAAAWFNVAMFTGFMIYGTANEIQENSKQAIVGYAGAGVTAIAAIALDLNGKLKRQKAINIYNNM